MTKIKTISITNIRSVKQGFLDLKGCTAIITAGNRKGKTTLLCALTDRLRGIKDDRVLKQGERDGNYVMELTTGEILSWDIKTGKNGLIEKLTYVSSNNIKSSITKDLSQYFFPKTFDVDEFLNEGPAKQRSILEKISKLEFGEVDKAYAAAYEERTFATREFDKVKAKEILFESHWGKESQAVYIEQLEAEINGIEAHNLRNKMVVSKVDEKKKITDSFVKQIEEKKSLIEKLLNEVSELEESTIAIMVDIERGNEWLSQDRNKPKDAGYTLSVKEKIKDVKLNEEAIKARKELEKAEKNYNESDREVKRIIADKEEMIRLADMPDGFGFNQFGITYEEMPFNKKSLSLSQLYIGALKLAARNLGEVKAIHFDASSLDKNSLELVNDWAESNNLQLLIERPDFYGGPIQYEIIETNTNESTRQ